MSLFLNKKREFINCKRCNKPLDNESDYCKDCVLLRAWEKTNNLLNCERCNKPVDTMPPISSKFDYHICKECLLILPKEG